MKTYRCKVDKWEAVDLEGILAHLEEEHAHLLSFTPAEQLYEECNDTSNEQVIEVLIENAPKGRKRYPYPKLPYSTDGETYSCDCPFEGNLEVFAQHMFTIHPGDTKAFLQRYTEDKILHDRKHKMPTAEPLTAEQVTKFAQRDVEEFLERLELQKGGEDALQEWVSNTSYPTYKAFIEGKRDYCPLCGLTQATFSVPNLQTSYKMTTMLNAVKKANPSLQNLSIAQMRDIPFEGTWHGDAIHCNFLNNLHFSIAHQDTYEELIASQILRGKLPMFLGTYFKKPSAENLTTLNLKSSTTGLSEEVKAFLKGLTPSKHV